MDAQSHSHGIVLRSIQPTANPHRFATRQISDRRRAEYRKYRFRWVFQRNWSWDVSAILANYVSWRCANDSFDHKYDGSLPVRLLQTLAQQTVHSSVLCHRCIAALQSQWIRLTGPSKHHWRLVSHLGCVRVYQPVPWCLHTDAGLWSGQTSTFSDRESGAFDHFLSGSTRCLDCGVGDLAYSCF